MRATITHLDNFKDVLDIRKEVLDHIPTRWPVYGDKGYKTSPYGVRYSPIEGKNKFDGVSLLAGA